MKKTNIVIYSLLFVLMLFLLVVSIDPAMAADDLNASAANETSAGVSTGNNATVSSSEAFSMINTLEYNLSIAKNKGYRMEQLDDILFEMKAQYSQYRYDSIPGLYAQAEFLLDKFYRVDFAYSAAQNALTYIEDRYIFPDGTIESSGSSQDSPLDSLPDSPPEYSQESTVLQGSQGSQESQGFFVSPSFVSLIRQNLSGVYDYIDTSNYDLSENSLIQIQSDLRLVMKEIFVFESDNVSSIIKEYSYDVINQSIDYTNQSTSKINQMDLLVNNYLEQLTQLGVIMTDAGIPDHGSKNLSYSEYLSLLASIDRIKKAYESQSVLSDIHDDILVLESNNHSTARLTEEYSVLMSLFDSGDYDALALQSRDLLVRVASIEKLSSDIASVQEIIDTKQAAGIDYSEAEYALNLSMEAFIIEDYEKSEEYLLESRQILDDIDSKNALKTFLYDMQSEFNIMQYIKDNIYKIIICIFVLSFVGVLSVFFMTMFLLKHKLSRLSGEQTVILSLVKRLQTDYYQDKVIDKDTYTSQYDSYQDRLGEIKRELPLLRTRLDKKHDIIKSVKNTLFGRFQSVAKKEVKKSNVKN